jgi:8-amino-7-oxononanoate synthase
MAVNRLMKRLGGDERVDLLRAVREADVAPYFRRMESAVAPVVRVEGKDKLMLGSNSGSQTTPRSSREPNMRWTPSEAR